jgi:hypothetical protein
MAKRRHDLIAWAQILIDCLCLCRRFDHDYIHFQIPPDGLGDHFAVANNLPISIDMSEDWLFPVFVQVGAYSLAAQAFAMRH